jgi:alpha-glucosidase (family GH31 glycosyl hydrolase)
VVFEARDETVAVHPALAEPPEAAWDESPPRSDAWREVAASVVAAAEGTAWRVEVHAEGSAWTGMRIERQAGERFWGLGVRSDAVERVTGVVECWVGEGPYQRDEYPLVEAITPRWAIRRRPDAAYFPIPWLMSSAGYGLLVDSPEYTLFRFEDQRAISVEVLADRMSVRFFAGATPADVLRAFTAATGRQPYPRAAWFLGPWISTGQADLVPLDREAAIIAALRDADAPVSAVETHMRRLPAGAHEGRRDLEQARTALFHRHGLASLTYLNPFVSEDYSARFGQAAPLLQRRADGTPYMYPAYIGGREPPVTIEGQLDFTNAGAAVLFADLATEAIQDGHDGWMEDFGEYTPVDALTSSGATGASAHNPYPTAYHAAGARAAVNAERPVARFGRSGWTGTAAHLPLVWGGDPTTGWGFDGLASALTQALSAGMSGIGFFGSDIGGFFTLGDEVLDIELLIRWIQLGSLSGLMRTKAEGVAIPPRARPQVWDADVIPHWRRWAKFHTQLSPYLMSAAAEYVETGMPLMRHLALVYPGDPAAGLSDQYLLGPSLLVAPVLHPGQRERTVRLPAGRWIDLWRSAAYDDETGGISPGRAHLVEGGGEVTVPAPLDEIPIFVREGAVISMLAPSVWSLFDPAAEPRNIELTFAVANA